MASLSPGGTWGKDRSAHWLARPVPWDFTRVELVPLVGSWGSLRGWLGGVSVRAGPFAGGAGLGHPEFHSSQTQVSQHRPEPRGASRRNWTWAGLEGRKLGRKGLHVSACWTVSAELGVFYHHRSRRLSTALPFVETRVCVGLSRSRD